MGLGALVAGYAATLCYDSLIASLIQDRRFVPVALTAGAAALYLSGLSTAFAFPLRDEMYFAVAAHSVATSGYDPAGHWLPVYFPIGPVSQPLMWFQPLLMYAMAAVLRVVPVSDAAIRVPMALAGVVNVLLMFAAARQLTKRDGTAAVAAGLLALSPAHFVFSRSGVDYLLPVTFILGWLWLALRYAENGERRDLVGAALCLGVGMYSLIASYILMPIYALLTVAFVRQRRAPVSHYALVIGTVALCALRVSRSSRRIPRWRAP